ncbi:MAG: LamG-like jellyroll fold domain-containing protein [Bacillota bacterium]
MTTWKTKVKYSAVVLCIMCAVGVLLYGHHDEQAQAAVDDSYTVSLMHYNSSATADESGKTWTAYGNATVDTTIYKLGSGSLKLDGDGDYLTEANHPDFDFSNGNFTIDFWFRPETVSGGSRIIIEKLEGQTGPGWSVFQYNDQIRFYCDGGAVYFWTGSVLQVGSWKHVAVVRNGSDWRIYIDGVSQASMSSTGTVGVGNNLLIIGARVGGGYPLVGCIDELRVSKGIARWTANFTPPTSEYASAVSAPSAPTGLTATAGDAQVDLSWDTVSGADTYNVKRSTTSGGPYTTIAESVTSTTYTDTGVTNGTTYYYVVSAVNAGGESGNSSEASATPQATGGNKALLVIKMADGTEKEYDLTASELNSFTSWFDNRANGTGPMRYTISKNYNLGPFTSRKDNIIFDKICSFEVKEY